MFFFKKQLKKESGRSDWLWLLYLAAVFFIAIDIIAASYLIFIELNKHKIYPGVSIGQIYLGGKTTEEAKKIIETKVNDINQSGIKFDFEDHEAIITPIISSFSGDFAYQIITFNTDNTVKNAFYVGRGQNFYENLLEQFKSLAYGQLIKTDFSYEKEKIKTMLSENFGQLEQPAKDAELFATTTPGSLKKELIFGIKSDSPGFKFNYDRALEKMRINLENLDSSPIKITGAKEYPAIRKNECQNIETQAKEFLDKAGLTLTFENKKWLVGKTQIADWLMLSRGIDNKITIDLNPDKIKNLLAEKIASKIEITPVNARFQIKDSRVIEFIASRDGQKIDFAKTFENLRAGFLTNNENSSAIAVTSVKSEIETKSLNDLGVTEIIGTGHSNFAGSPKNRIHNIGVGAASLNGLLIAPSEEFSTVKALGEVTAATGYLPEMTIKGDKTVPEYGGGLCQIGTTVFRAALASGFPITARQPHSYRVVYYEPAGTDATIYGPWPDLRFINDSKNYILIQTRINGNDIYFDFWGTKDGRIIEETDPVIYNIVKPEPTKIVETTDLAPGIKKCTERAHNGANAYFDYKVTYPDGIIKEERFKSHYVPWREVCLIGVEKLSATSTPTSTPAIILPKQ